MVTQPPERTSLMPRDPAARPALMNALIRGVSLLVVTHAVVAQDLTPARIIGQTSPGFIPSYPIESESLKQQQSTPQIINDSGLSIPNYDTPYPWWEQVESVALETMHPPRFDVQLSATAGWEYDDNPYLSTLDTESGETESTVEGSNSYFFRLPVSLSYSGAAVNLSASYVPEFRTNDHEGIDDTFNHAASFSVTYSSAKLQLGMDVSFAQTDGGNVEVGDRVKSIGVVSSVSASYTVSPKTTVGTSFSYSDNIYEQFISSRRYGAQTFVDYAVTAKTQLGVGVGYDQSEVEYGADSGAVSATGRVSWQATSKFALRAVIGGEWRQNEEIRAAIVPGSDEPVTAEGTEQFSPIFSLGALYNARENTSISLDAYRRSSPSISEVNQSYYSTGMVLAVNQRVYDRFSCSLNLGYENADYQATVEGVVADRKDDYWYIRPQVSYAIRTQLTVALYYQYSKNASTGSDGVSFDVNLVGATVSYGF